MKKIAVFPGSFDPITTGHEDLVKRAVPLFDKIIVAVGVNSSKKYLYSLEQRLEWLEKVFADEPTVDVYHFEGLTANFCASVQSNYLLRGLRNASDFDYEKTISQLNNIVGEGLETVFLISKPEFSHISSTIVREIIKGKGDVSPFIPSVIDLNVRECILLAKIKVFLLWITSIEKFLAPEYKYCFNYLCTSDE
jgi:pantetheine-phosphate adenylyltransferase